MKKLKISISIVVVLLLGFMVVKMFTADNISKEVDSDVPFDYMTNLKTMSFDNYNDLSIQDKKLVYSIPNDIAKNLTTEALLETILNNEYLVDLFAYDDFVEAVKSFEDQFRVIEFLKREDSTEVLDRYIEKYEEKAYSDSSYDFDLQLRFMKKIKNESYYLLNGMEFTLSEIKNEFLNLERHLELIAYVIPFSFINTHIPLTFHYLCIFVFQTLKRCMSMVRFIILYWFLPYICVVFISQKERKINKKYVAIIDAVCFLALFLFAYNYANSYAHLSLIHYQMFDWCNSYLVTLRIIGLLASLFYSICLNFRLLKKYFVFFKLQKYEKFVFKVSVILLILLSYIFLFLYLDYLFNAIEGF